MSEIIEALKGILTVIAVGVPALLILLGFAAVMGGFTLELITGNIGMKNFGIVLIILGVFIYIVEIVLYYYSQQ